MPRPILSAESAESTTHPAVSWVVDTQGHVYGIQTARLNWLRSRGVTQLQITIDLDDDGSPEVSKIEAAIGILAYAGMNHEEISDEAIAKRCRCTPQNLQKNKHYRRARDARNGDAPPRGFRTDGGGIESESDE